MRSRSFLVAFLGVALLALATACVPDQPPTTPLPLGPTCFKNPAGRDLLYGGTPDRVANVRVTPSNDGSCSGVDPTFAGRLLTIVSAADERAAGAKCLFLTRADFTSRPFPPAGYEPTTSDLWDCGVID